jgi:hypothetical protein
MFVQKGQRYKKAFFLLVILNHFPFRWISTVILFISLIILIQMNGLSLFFFFLLVKQVDGSSIIFIIILAPLDLYSFRASFSINI